MYRSSPHTRISTIKVCDLHFCLIHIISFSRYSFQTLPGALVTGAYADRRKTLTSLLPMSFSTNQIAIMRAPKSLCNSEPMAFHAITPLCLAPTPTPWEPLSPFTMFHKTPWNKSVCNDHFQAFHSHNTKFLVGIWRKHF